MLLPSEVAYGSEVVYSFWYFSACCSRPSRNWVEPLAPLDVLFFAGLSARSSSAFRFMLTQGRSFLPEADRTVSVAAWKKLKYKSPLQCHVKYDITCNGCGTYSPQRSSLAPQPPLQYLTSYNIPFTVSHLTLSRRTLPQSEIFIHTSSPQCRTLSKNRKQTQNHDASANILF